MKTPKKSFDRQRRTSLVPPQRFIPNRAVSSLLKFPHKAEFSQNYSFSDLLQLSLFPSNTVFCESPTIFSIGNSVHQTTRNPPKFPYKTLEAPGLKDDFYVDLLDWSSLNSLTVGLGNTICSWDASSSRLKKAIELPRDFISALKFSSAGYHLAVGTDKGSAIVFDTQTNQRVHCYSLKYGRIGTLSWNSSVLTAGTQAGAIVHFDARVPAPFKVIFVHDQEICKVKWSPSGRILATGSNDSSVNVWDLGSSKPTGHLVGHTSAVKAVDWSPYYSEILVTGGGTNDQSIRLWDTHCFSELYRVDSGSQVCGLLFSLNSNEIVSTHGYNQNSMSLWSGVNLQKQGTLAGHSKRVLFSCLSPSGETLVTGGGDETLKFWRLFPTHEFGVLNSNSLPISNLR